MMRKYFAMVGIGLALSLSNFAQTEKELSTRITDVTVYISGAQVERNGNTTVNSGSSKIVLKGLSPYIDASSVQVKGKGNFIILSVNHKLNYLNQTKKPKEIIALEDSIEALYTQIKVLGGMESVYNQEESMILSNKSIGNKEVGVDALDLEEVANLFRRRLMEISAKRIGVQEEVARVRIEVVKLNKQLLVLNGKRNRPTGEITITVSAKERTPAKFSVSYFISGAGWKPLYDIRAKNVTSPITLDYKAKVFQNSGVDWNKVKLTLSTMNPKRSGTQPTLNPWTLQYQTRPTVYGIGNYKRGKVSGYMNADSVAPTEKITTTYKSTPKATLKAESTVQYTTVTEITTSVEFKISLLRPITPDTQNTCRAAPSATCAAP